MTRSRSVRPNLLGGRHHHTIISAITRRAPGEKTYGERYTNGALKLGAFYSTLCPLYPTPKHGCLQPCNTTAGTSTHSSPRLGISTVSLTLMPAAILSLISPHALYYLLRTWADRPINSLAQLGIDHVLLVPPLPSTPTVLVDHLAVCLQCFFLRLLVLSY